MTLLKYLQVRLLLHLQFNMDKFDKSCIGLVDQLLSMDVETLNIKIHICIYWCILKACTETVKGSNSVCSLLFVIITWCWSLTFTLK